MSLLSTRTRQRSAGFTLLELLVVIAIIGVLMALFLGAVMKVLGKTDEVRVRSDIAQFSQAIGLWNAKFSVEGPFPSRLKLCKYYADYDLRLRNVPTDPSTGLPINALDLDSMAFLLRMWPRLIVTTKDKKTGQLITHFAAEDGRIDWDGQKGGSGQWTLQGQECLVFFLGGIPKNVHGVLVCSGFSASTDPSYHIKYQDPPQTTTQPTTKPKASIIPPFFAFQSDRLKVGQSGAFYHYLDAFGKQPYAYFSSYKSHNGYNRYGKYFYGGTSDCAALPGIQPFDIRSNDDDPRTHCPWPTCRIQDQYMNPDSYQIVSAGRDCLFGGGTLHPEGAGQFFLAMPPMFTASTDQPGGYDDLTNWWAMRLGIPPEN
jgi:prepilin-type N-terminal cleavage/methylation domain-containing protein